MTPLIQSLWIGGALSPVEQLSIASFLAHGHEYHLYAYDAVEQLPRGAVLEDAGAILPETAIFRYRKHPSYSGFSNFFRYKLLLEKGGWWVDTDVVCLKPFAFPEPYVFASERLDGGDVATSAVIKVPAGSDVMAFNWHLCQACADPAGAAWGQYGPKLMARSIAKFGLDHYRKPAAVFCPLAFDEWEAVLAPGEIGFGPETRALHLWNEMWRRAGHDKASSYHSDCVYERLKTRFLSGQQNASETILEESAAQIA
jgi:hypothetical protein